MFHSHGVNALDSKWSLVKNVLRHIVRGALEEGETSQQQTQCSLPNVLWTGEVSEGTG